ncbi:MAG: transcriptional regulator [Proteobacteria bacterium]|nr:transcriptional regulator [Pseudomonadota bacterium]
MRQIPSEQVVDWAQLRAEREARGLSLSQVSAQLKLTPRQIEAIEHGDLSALPGAAFSRGFVRNYARFLQLDPAPFLALIDVIEGHEPAGISAQMYSPSLGRMPSSGNPRFSALPAALLVLLLVIVLGAGWYFRWFEAREETALQQGEVQSEPVSEVPASAPEASAAASAGAVGASEPGAAMSAAPAASAPVVPASAPQAGQSVPVAVAVAAQSAANSLPRIVLGFDGESWVEVRDASAKVVFGRLSQAGVVQEIQGSGPFTLVIGNAPKVKLSWKGKPVDLLPYTKGDVARLTLQ